MAGAWLGGGVVDIVWDDVERGSEFLESLPEVEKDESVLDWLEGK